VRWTVAALLGLVGLALVVIALSASVSRFTVSPQRIAAPSAAALTPGAEAGATSTPRSPPVLLVVPALGIRTTLSELGLNVDGTVQVPTNFAQPGWFGLGPSPGQLGSSVILGHVDDHEGPAIFFELSTLRPGDELLVVLADGSRVRFAVSTVSTYLKSQFPDALVYGSHGSSELELVTCGGAFDRSTGSYLSNVVVSSNLVSITTKTTSSGAAAPR
jgi:hypothetical protein